MFFRQSVLFVLLYCSICFGAQFNEHFNLVSNPYAEESFTGWTYTNADIFNDSASAGTKSFRLIPATTTRAQIRTVRMPVDAQQNLKIGYSFKSLPGAVIGASSSYVMFRFYDAGGNKVGGNNFELSTTSNQWVSADDQAFAPAGTVEMDIRIVVNMNDDGGAAGQFLFDDIFVYRELYPLGLTGTAPGKLYVINKTRLSDPREFLMIQSLQGVVAQTAPQIYIRDSETTYLDDLLNVHGLTMRESNSLYFYLNTFRSHITGYILYDIDDEQSMLAASSLAGIMQAVMVDVDIESDIINSYGAADPLNLPKLIDVRGKDCWWVYQNYGDQFDKNGIMIKNPYIGQDASAYYIRDMGIAKKLLWWWGSSSIRTAEVLEQVIDNSHCWGWDDPSAPGELAATQFHSEYSLYTGATAAVSNLSTLAVMGQKYPGLTLEQKIDDNVYTPESNVHYVCFMMSDMDNIGTELGNNGWHVSPNYFGYVNRGHFPMGWGMPASLYELAPTVVQWWYRNATENDSFTAACSGLGYMYSSYFPDLENHTRKTEQLIEKANLRTCVIADKWYPRSMTYSSYYPYAHMYSRLDNIRGMFYFDVNGDYARYDGDILWFDGKPMVTCRYTLWDSAQYNGISRDAEDLADSLNSRPTNPYSESGYSFV